MSGNNESYKMLKEIEDVLCLFVNCEGAVARMGYSDFQRRIVIPNLSQLIDFIDLSKLL